MRKLFIVLFILLFRLDLGLTSAYPENRILPPSNLRIVQSTIIDSYSMSNKDNTFDCYSRYPRAGQAITGNGMTLDRVKFFMAKVGSPTGNATVVLRAESHATAFGIDSVGTGDALATSDPFDVSTLPAGEFDELGQYKNMVLTTFNFSTPYTLVKGTNYVVTFEYPGGGVTDYVLMGTDASSTTHAGNFVTYISGFWIPYAGTDACFYLISNQSAGGPY